jgi:hypothetical protein
MCTSLQKYRSLASEAFVAFTACILEKIRTKYYIQHRESSLELCLPVWEFFKEAVDIYFEGATPDLTRIR